MAHWPEVQRSANSIGVYQIKFNITQSLKADLDGDGDEDHIFCYREPENSGGHQGGVLIISCPVGRNKISWHAMFENAYPQSAVVEDNGITFTLIHNFKGKEQRISKKFILGKDFFLRDDERSPFAKVEVRATSTLSKKGISPANVFDQNPNTSWAEGSDSTGVDESISFAFKNPVDLALIGVLHGDVRNKRTWLDNNRIHRAEVTVETSSDRYDADSDVDFSDDLGLGLYGDRTELSFTNRPVMRYFKLQKKSVLSLDLKITSVLLGEKNDDAYIAEVDLVELVPQSVLLGTAPNPKKQSATQPKDKSKESPEDDWTQDDF